MIQIYQVMSYKLLYFGTPGRILTHIFGFVFQYSLQLYYRGIWMSGWDLNPRLCGFADRCIGPLCHPTINYFFNVIEKITFLLFTLDNCLTAYAFPTLENIKLNPLKLNFTLSKLLGVLTNKLFPS